MAPGVQVTTPVFEGNFQHPTPLGEASVGWRYKLAVTPCLRPTACPVQVRVVTSFPSPGVRSTTPGGRRLSVTQVHYRLLPACEGTAAKRDHTYPTTSRADQSHSSAVLTSPTPPVGSMLLGAGRTQTPPRPPTNVFRTIDSCERPPSTNELGAGVGGDTKPLPHLLRPSGASVGNPSPSHSRHTPPK